MNLKNFLWLLLLAAVWGPSFLFIKVAVAEIPPVTLVAGRVGLAAVLLYLILKLQGRALPGKGVIWRHFAVMGLVSNAVPFVLFSWGEQHIDSALAAIMNGTTPLFTIVLAHFFTADDRLTPVKAAGTLLGFGGLALLIAPSLQQGVRVQTWGIIALAVAAACYGVSIIYSRRHLRGLPPLVAPTAQLLMATVYLLPLSLLIDSPWRLPILSWPALGSWVVLGIVGTALGFVIYYRILERMNATALSMVTYLMPVIGVFLGVVVLNERLTWHSCAGCALILLGVMTVNGVFTLAGWRRLAGTAVRP